VAGPTCVVDAPVVRTAVLVVVEAAGRERAVTLAGDVVVTTPLEGRLVHAPSTMRAAKPAIHPHP